mmetsp:Transcript_26679/g.58652  ORF Transcript_26679/g.58652 Transcript_26679/m.58652 type:complete len:171 (+) Transcript_26679:103-615(+)|eukprot:CAMPEP_0170609600 /NCGR_PEP_ID=MMETSP0224-20130122/22211_1 /TAXON_ID=285029 /ORGANISM="Togula jolla, Strain CCCM 725" /LENGTH=170 /DNA_ID=CAMNT_0010934917 /DNA_START=102 /DNA_END=614 /DNA_ORIENTATION=-
MGGFSLTSVASLSLMGSLIAWQTAVLYGYKEGGPWLAFGDHKAIGGSCESVLLLLEKSLILTIFILLWELLDVSLFVLGPLAKSRSFAVLATQMGHTLLGATAQIIAGVVGLRALSQVNKDDCMACSNLYETTWSSLVAVLIFGILTSCSASCEIDSLTGARADEMAALV